MRQQHALGAQRPHRTGLGSSQTCENQIRTCRTAHFQTDSSRIHAEPSAAAGQRRGLGRSERRGRKMRHELAIRRRGRSIGRRSFIGRAWGSTSRRACRVGRTGASMRSPSVLPARCGKTSAFKIQPRSVVAHRRWHNGCILCPHLPMPLVCHRPQPNPRSASSLGDTSAQQSYAPTSKGRSFSMKIGRSCGVSVMR